MADISGPASQRVLIREPWPAVSGRPGLVQGTYGTNGNLELVACAEDDGLWVGWFNADDQEAHEGAAIGRWSGALRFGRGHRCVSAAITQVKPGPDFLEVVALTDGQVLRRHVWTPADGFVDHGSLGARVRSHSAIVEMPDGALVVAVARDGACELLRAIPGSGYPSAEFTVLRDEVGSAPEGAVRCVDAARHDDHLDVLIGYASGSAHLGCGLLRAPGTWSAVAEAVEDARLGVAENGRVAVICAAGGARLLDLDTPTAQPQALGPADDVALAPALLDGRRQWHVVTRDASRLMHHAHAALQAPEPVDAQAWLPPGARTAHRGT